MDFETIDFAITLSAKHWNKYPKFSIWLDDELIVQNDLTLGTDTIKFAREVAKGDHAIKIRLENKTNQDTVVKDGEIVNDMLINIDDITIDDISLGNLIWSAEYLLDEPQEYQGKTIDHLDHCINLGWNGTYILKFSSPFYIWLLEKL